MGIIVLGKESKNIILCMRKSKCHGIFVTFRVSLRESTAEPELECVSKWVLFVSKLVLVFISPITDQAFWNNTNNANSGINIALVSFSENQISLHGD